MILLAINWTNILIITVLGIGIVFLILILLMCVLNLFGKVFANHDAKATTTPKQVLGSTSNAVTVDASETEKAAIAVAIYLHNHLNVHDHESYVITNTQNGPTAWNAKVFGINKL